MPEQQHRPFLLVLTSHWLSMVGVTLVTLAGFSWSFALPANIRGNVQNPYIGLLVFIAIPALFFTGLILIPIGIVLGKRQVAERLEALPDRRAAWRRAGIFFAVMTLANIIIGSQLTYRSVEHMETVQFCGQTCHVMQPEFMAHLVAPHQEVGCAACHIAPGATGWFEAKMAGTKQLVGVVFNTFRGPSSRAWKVIDWSPRPRPASNAIRGNCSIGPRLRIKTNYKADEPNTRTQTVLTMLVGGGRRGGIRGAHMGPGTYSLRGPGQETANHSLGRIQQQRHWRHAGLSGGGRQARRGHYSHGFRYAMRGLPQPGGALFRSSRSCRGYRYHRRPDRRRSPLCEEDGSRFDQGRLRQRRRGRTEDSLGSRQLLPAEVSRRGRQACRGYSSRGPGAAAIYRRNVFPDLKVTWGTYPNNLGHGDDPGCFRCHDDSHAMADKKTITQDCNTCHLALAVEEPSPEILKSLGVADTLTSARK